MVHGILLSGKLLDFLTKLIESRGNCFPYRNLEFAKALKKLNIDKISFSKILKLLKKIDN